jgi:hypothetical protein
MVRSDRGICEEYKTAGQRPAYLVEFAAPPMPEIAVGQPMMAQPAMLPAAKPTAPPAMLPAAQPIAPPAAAPLAADPPAPAQPVLAAAKEEHGAAPDARTATPEGAKAAKPTKAVAEKAAVVMEADDSMKLNFGGGRSDAAVLAQLQAAIATWRREVDQPAPAAPAPAEPSPEAAQPAAPDHPAEQ